MMTQKVYILQISQIYEVFAYVKMMLETLYYIILLNT